MGARKGIPKEVTAEVIATARRRCCACFALSNDVSEKRGQVAHLDRDASNNARKNLLYLCLDHHDQYDSRTSQSKGITLDEMRLYEAQLARYIAKNLPLSDLDVACSLLVSLDRPAFRTPFHGESSLPRFREAIAEAIATVNTGKMADGRQMLSKNDIGDAELRNSLDAIVGALVSLRATFDGFIRTGEIRPCGCGDADCSAFELDRTAIREMDRRRHDLLKAAQQVAPALPADFYGLTS